MYVLKSARMPVADYTALRGDDAPCGGLGDGACTEPLAVIYLDPRALTRDCVGGWLRSSLSGCDVCVLSDPDQIERTAIAGDRVLAVIINAGPERYCAAVAGLAEVLR